MLYAMQNCVVEFSLVSDRNYEDPFNEIDLDVRFSGPDGKVRIIPAFWSGGNVWRVRFSSPLIGEHKYRTVCSDMSDSGLHDKEGSVMIKEYEGDNNLFKHGNLRVSHNKRYLEHNDGTPFLWLADTWWMGLVKRLKWPEGFQQLATDRVNKGYTVIQIVAGLYPDMEPFDERGANEAGLPWDKNFSQINPHYFDMADLRIAWLVQSGLVPCIVGCWGYFLDFAGVDKMKKHWRYLLARYGAYPVIWCIAGEVIMPYYCSKAFHDNDEKQDYIIRMRKGWTEVARYLRSIDPYNHLITAHPAWHGGRDMLNDVDLIDIDMLQPAHDGKMGAIPTAKQVISSYNHKHTMPVLVGEVSYEGEHADNRQDVQRFMFWLSMLSGTCGHTYGANGIWQVNSRNAPFGPSPHGRSYGNIPWEDAYQLPGSKQIGIGKKLLERYEWWRFEPRQDWVEPHANENNYFQCYASGIPEEVRIFYLPPFFYVPLCVKNIENGITYRAFYFNPMNGQEYVIGYVEPDEKGNWIPEQPPIFQDWVLVLEAVK